MLEYPLISSLTIDGNPLDASLVMRLQWIEGLDPLLPLVMLEMDDLQGIFEAASMDSTMGVSLKLPADRQTAQNETATITSTFSILRKSRMPNFPSRYRLLLLKTEMRKLLRKAVHAVTSGTPEMIVQTILGLGASANVSVPVANFHCLHQRPIVPLANYLRENGLLLGFVKNELQLFDIAKLMEQEVKLQFSLASAAALHPALNVRTFSGDFLSEELHNLMPFSMDMVDGAPTLQTENLKLSEVPNEISRTRGTWSLVPECDFQTQPTFKVRAGDKIEIYDDVNQKARHTSVIVRVCWQQFHNEAMCRILTAKPINFGGI